MHNPSTIFLSVQNGGLLSLDLHTMVPQRRCEVNTHMGSRHREFILSILLTLSNKPNDIG